MIALCVGVTGLEVGGARDGGVTGRRGDDLRIDGVTTFEVGVVRRGGVVGYEVVEVARDLGL